MKAMIHQGRITYWNEKKGFGFIAPDKGNEKIFFHIKAFGNRHLQPAIDQQVFYGLTKDARGRLRADRAALEKDALIFKSNVSRSSRLLVSSIISTLFFCFIGLAVHCSKISPWLLCWYCVVSLFTYSVYAVDKSAAQQGAWRTRENTLHVLSLIGGWPGALTAQQKFRHKTRKIGFRVIFWITVLMNCGALAYLFTPEGAAIFQELIANLLRELTL